MLAILVCHGLRVKVGWLINADFPEVQDEWGGDDPHFDDLQTVVGLDELRDRKAFDLANSSLLNRS